LGRSAKFFWSTFTVATTSPPATEVRRASGRLFLGLGILLVLLGPILYAVEIKAKHLPTPWHAPALAAVGIVLVIIAVWRRPNLWRITAFVLFGLIAAGQWFMFLVASKVPPYTGPVAIGAAMPAFKTTLADGSPFDQDSLRGEQDTVLVFFRGRW
jgi:hypothetical protein